ncbi:hypothetical protein QQF64_020743 [Cirrhinus molitorella]|uniref:Uncharacterized protein n=1 Tax=Cirrhinus molitorella TaxID=172907 RepID=A0ABR3LDY3_9TELE
MAERHFKDGRRVERDFDVLGLSWLTRLCNIAWRSGTVPLDWATGMVATLFKKRDQTVCSNYREITLLSLPGKVYARVLERRICQMVEPQIQVAEMSFLHRVAGSTLRESGIKVLQ